MNKITVNGRIARDLELKQANSGASYVKFSVASMGKAKKEDGSRKVDFFNCLLIGVASETLCKYCKKGDPIIITGTMISETNNNITYWTIQVEDFEFISSGGKQQNNEKVNTTPAPTQNYQSDKSLIEEKTKEIDLPF